jgi:hypothetical protein
MREKDREIGGFRVTCWGSAELVSTADILRRIELTVCYSARVPQGLENQDDRRG